MGEYLRECQNAMRQGEVLIDSEITRVISYDSLDLKKYAGDIDLMDY